MKYGVIGASGKLGSEVTNVFAEAGHKLVFTFDIDGEWSESTPKILIDCSLPSALPETIGFVEKFKTPLVIATTGLSDKHIKQLKELSKKYPVVQSYNFSIGIQVLIQLTKKANELLKDWDVEISETHHRFKKDKPSGTAKMIKEIFNKTDVNVTSKRLGNVPGDHSISFGALGETISIEHRALSRRTFAEGILLSAEFALKKKNGFYSFTNVISEIK
ncbi:MAG TPA: dihydrodipicolinate reductase C-terminal domain-containing protein [Ignavibacteriaceae bacterium]|jgi:4-hydroxy-tetrahydrodipicolinate reductase